jgi:RNase adapter protein RapZ
MTDTRALELAVITGLSGAGKSEAVATFEDMGYFCIDNLPPQMLPRVVELFGLEGSRVDRVALVFDVRGGAYFDEVGGALRFLREAGIPFRLLFLEASDEALVSRYQSTRRPHPLSRSGLIVGIDRERTLLAPLRSQADLVIDTSDLSPRALRRRLEETLMAGDLQGQLFLSLLSFGFKHSLPEDADMVLDARFLPNPYWMPELRDLTGMDLWVKDFVLSREEAGLFLDKVVDLVRLLAPRFIAEQKPRVVLAVGCTGGRHRSVVLVEELARRLKEEPGLVTSVTHRDMEREA